MRYPGGKGISYRRIINLIPPHRVYLETHLGGGSVLRNKRPAHVDIGIDIDETVIRTWRRNYGDEFQVMKADAADFLQKYQFTADEVVYVDPPYFPTTRRRNSVYRFDYTEADHENLLSILVSLRCFVLLSGYNNAMYARELRHWNSITFTAGSQSGGRQEKVWFNFEPPEKLHDPRFLGDTFRDREIIKRRLQRLRKRINRLTPPEKNQLLGWLQSCCGVR